MDNDFYRRLLARLARSGTLDIMKCFDEQQAERHQRIAEQLSERVANICRLPIERIEEQQARLAKTIYDNVVRSINAQTYATANNIAARALASSLQTRVRAVELIQRGQVDDLIKRATDLAAAPQTQALL